MIQENKMGRAIVNKVTYSAEIWACDENGDCVLVRRDFEFTDPITPDMLSKANDIIAEAVNEGAKSIPSIKEKLNEIGIDAAVFGLKRIEDLQ